MRAEGSLVHVNGDRWRVRFNAGTRYGQRRQISRTFTASKPRDAQKQAQAIIAAFRAEEKKRATLKGTVQELVDDWLAVKERTCSPTTMRPYRRHSARIVKRFGRMQAAELTGRDIDRFYAELAADGWSDANLHHMHRVLRAILSFGHRKRDLPSIATARATPPDRPEHRLRAPSVDLMRNLMMGDGDKPGIHGEWGRAVALLVLTGMRRGEVVGLRWEDWHDHELDVRRALVDVKGGGVVVRPFPKGKKPRTLELSPAAVVVLDRQQRHQQQQAERYDMPVSPWVFPSRKLALDGSQPHPPGWVSLMWDRHRTLHGAKGMRLHDARHWFATQAIALGAPVTAVSELLGHAQTSTTVDVYGSGTKVGKREAVEAVAALLPGLADV